MSTEEASQASLYEQWSQEERERAIAQFFALSAAAQKVLIAAGAFGGKSQMPVMVKSVADIPDEEEFKSALEELVKAGLVTIENQRIAAHPTIKEKIRLVKEEVWQPQETKRWKERFERLVGENPTAKRYTLPDETLGDLTLLVSQPRVRSEKATVQEILHPRLDHSQATIIVSPASKAWEASYRWEEIKGGKHFLLTGRIRQEVTSPLGESLGSAFDIPQPNIRRLDGLLNKMEQALQQKGKK